MKYKVMIYLTYLVCLAIRLGGVTGRNLFSGDAGGEHGEQPKILFRDSLPDWNHWPCILCDNLIEIPGMVASARDSAAVIYASDHRHDHYIPSGYFLALELDVLSKNLERPSLPYGRLSRKDGIAECGRFGADLLPYFKRISILKNQLSIKARVGRDRLAHVLNIKKHWKFSGSIWGECQRACDGNIDVEPWTLGLFHLVKLPLHGIKLSTGINRVQRGGYCHNAGRQQHQPFVKSDVLKFLPMDFYPSTKRGGWIVLILSCCTFTLGIFCLSVMSYISGHVYGFRGFIGWFVLGVGMVLISSREMFNLMSEVK